MTNDQTLAEMKNALQPAVNELCKPGETVNWPALVRQVVKDWGTRS